MTTPPLAQIETATNLIDHAAQQDMRWWFLGLLVVFGAALWIVARYFATRHDRLSARLDKVQDDRTQDLKDDKAKLLQVLAENTSAFKGFSEMLGSLKHLVVPPAPTR